MLSHAKFEFIKDQKKRPQMKQRIINFDQDEEGNWRAELKCGHFQHVRHNPPLSTRNWVLTKEGRNSRLGFELDCKHCDADLQKLNK